MWNKINIKTGQAIMAANELTGIDKDIAILIALFGHDVDYWESMPESELKSYIARTVWIEELPTGKYLAPFRKGNYLYKFRTQPGQLSTNETAMLMKYGTDPVANLHMVMSLLSTKFSIIPPRVCKIKDAIKEHEWRSEMFLNHLPFGMAYSYAVFFSTCYPAFSRIGLSSLAGKMKAVNQFLRKEPTQP